MTEKRLGALIPVRLASERLPQKAIREICGRPALWHLLERVAGSVHLQISNIVVCTTCEASDDPLVGVVEQYGCSVFRGSTEDLIRRLREAMVTYDFDAVIQVDGDDILCDTTYMDATMGRLLEDPSLDIVTCEELPLGIASKSFTRAAMEKVYAHYRTERNDTGFIYFFTRTRLCKQAAVGPLDPHHVLPGARLTLDYEEDLEVLEVIFEALYQDGRVFGLDEVVSFLRENPHVMRINSFLDQVYWERTRARAQLLYADAHGVVRNV